MKRIRWPISPELIADCLLAVLSVEVFVLPSQSSPLSARAPADAPTHGKPDRVLPILAAPELVGEIRPWGGSGWLPPKTATCFGTWLGRWRWRLNVHAWPRSRSPGRL